MATTEFPAVEEAAAGRNAPVQVEPRGRGVVRFAGGEGGGDAGFGGSGGDAGGGIQLAGGRFTDATAVFGNDLATLPSFPAEIRAPAGRLAGVSSFPLPFAARALPPPAVFGNDLAPLPSFPAEIRAPAGSLAGVSSFQIHFAERDIATPGDTPN